MSESLAPLGSLLESLVARIAAVEAQLGMSPPPMATAAGGGQASAPEPAKKAAAPEAPRSIRAYDEYLRENLDPFLAAAEKLGGHAVVLADIVKEGWHAQREFLLMATAVKEPAQAKLPPKLGPINSTIQKANKAIQRNDFEFHAKTVAEGMQALTWVIVKPAPRDFIENFVGASDFWGNKIRVQHKKTAPDQVAFVDTFKKLILELMAYVKEWHTTGVAWNAKGVDIDAYSGEAASAPTPAPPAPTPAPAKTTATADAAGGDGGKKALFGDLSKGLDITSGLKKVTKDQQTWRPEFKADDKSAPPPPQPGAKKPATGVTPKAAPVKGPPKCVYDGAAFRWNVENYVEGVHTVEVGEKNQSVYIYGCGNAIIDVRGKGKSVTLDNCKRTQVLVDEMLSSLEVVNCQGVKVQVRAKVPTVAIDKTDGIIVILSKDALDAVITTSKSSEMNIQYPKNDDGELAEMPIPEQWCHRIKGSLPNISLENTVSDLYGH